MSLWSVSQPARKVQAVSLAWALACGLTLTLPAPAMAGSGEPASKLFSTKNKVTDSAGPAANNWSHAAPSGGKATTVSRIVNDGSVAPFVSAGSAASLQALADRYASIAASGGWPKVPSGKLSKGSTNKAVEALNKRLYAEGYLRVEATTGEYAQIYTTATEDAVRRFQANHGLAVTGSIDGPTLQQLNVPADRRLATIRANIPRLAEYSKDLGERYVVVNVPAQQIETIQSGTVYSLHNAIVGRPSRPTPVVMAPLATVRFNPYWNAPASIVERDIVPRMLSSSPSKVMADMNMKIFKGVGGPEIDPNSVNWRSAVVDDYHFRQEPGGENAMATAKIEFNSPFGIYLHDTPEPQLFNTGARFYSSGCVRVQNVATLINWVLQGQDGIDPSRIAGLAESKERLDTPIKNPPQLRVAYLTAWPAKDGVAAFRDDVYDLDGTGFVVGQPMPVGESGPRFVLKPIPRTPDAVDADEAFGFASLFRSSRNTDKQDTAAMARSASTGNDSLISTSSKTASKTTAKSAAAKNKFAKATSANGLGLRNGNSDKEGGIRPLMSSGDGATKKKPAKKLPGATKTRDGAKTAAKSSEKAATKTAAKNAGKDKLAKADAKAPADGKKVKKADGAQAAAKKTETAPAAKAAAQKPDAAQCKAGAGGKLPPGCKDPAGATAKKPAVKIENTASAVN